MKTLSVFVLIISGCLLGFQDNLRAQEANALTNIMSNEELLENIQLWKSAREWYYRAWYGREFSISVTREAMDFLVGQYTMRILPTDFTEDREMAKAVIRADMETVLNRSQFVAMTRQQGAPIWYLVKGLSELVINQRDVEIALQAEDCNVIPCPPDMCDPDTCATRSFQRIINPRLGVI